MKKHLSRNSQRSFDIALRDFKAVTGLDENSITQHSIEEWDSSMKSRGLSVSTRRQRLSLVLQKNKAIDFSLPERKQPTQYYLKKEQIFQLLSSLPQNATGLADFFMFALFLLTGKRNSQIRNLRWDELIQNGDFLFIGKECE